MREDNKMKKKFLIPFEKELHSSDFLMPIKKENCIKFLNNLTDDEIKKYGNALFFIYPNEIRKQIGNARDDKMDRTFVDDFRQEYGLSDRMTTTDKINGRLLLIKVANSGVDGHVK